MAIYEIIPDPMNGSPASEIQLQVCFGILSTFARAYGEPTDTTSKIQDAWQAEAKKLLAYVRDPAGSEVLLMALDEDDELVDYLRRKQAGIEGMAAAEGAAFLGAVMAEASNTTRSEEYELTIDDAALLRQAGYGSDVRAVVVSYVDNRLSPGETTDQDVVAYILTPPSVNVDYNLAFALVCSTSGPSQPIFKFERGYDIVPSSLPETQELGETVADDAELWRHGLGRALGEKAIRFGEVRALITLLWLHVEKVDGSA